MGRDYALEVLVKLASGPTSWVIVAADGAEVIGFSMGVKSSIFYVPSKSMASSLCLWVRPEHRRTRAAAELVAGVERWAKEHGADVVSMGAHCSVASQESAASSLYLANGYHRAELSFSKVL